MIKTLVTAGVITLGVALAPPAQALTNISDKQRAENLICSLIAENPTVNGLLGLALFLTVPEPDGPGLTGEEAGTAIGISVRDTCPKYIPLVKKFVQVYG